MMSGILLNYLKVFLVSLICSVHETVQEILISMKNFTLFSLSAGFIIQ